MLPHDSYFWDNTWSTGTINLGIQNGGSLNCVLENSEYWDDIGSGDDDFTTGTTRPSTCTNNDVFWETGSKKLYRCIGNSWSLVYEQYAYPHPLATGEIIEPPEPTCQNQGYVCCDSCASGTPQSAYDSDCSSVCCGSCLITSSYYQANEVVEAEDGVLVSMSGSDYIYTTTSNTGSASYTFEVPAGDYVLEAYVNSRASGGTDSFFVGLDSENPGTDIYYMFKLPLDDGFGWADVNRWGTGSPEFDPMVWSLSGVHTFTFYGREANTWLDKIRLVSQTCVPVSLSQLISIMDDWKLGTKNINTVMQSIKQWKNGC